ncbi:hypothetical protein PC129_g19887 [Phytophthora cactorum]|uniref:EF-hand domain-containing protein n=1 Tax=Phytophthora cactorum TaxID=29920 RepID=A0A329RL20_9STRA|nr:hypothetical protein Pcac1_g16281 [Phytophthora cactorum]KAG2805092.1 hypothetical protein PC112_g18417 [Phytophthora cactorum]KAG2806491.1 hypothetical protein PC111_g17349 [Phytophthora cactorum]KAG2839870.1 hypothetical protein PC113_g19378 [Phytophthora cactorum]KAG2892277.1 hypothetical protein PC115_g18891 [Phytophthora cactorum]
MDAREPLLDGDEHCRELFKKFDKDKQGVLSREGVRSFIHEKFVAKGIECMGELDYDIVVDKVFHRRRQEDRMTYSEFETDFAPIESDDKSKEEHGKLMVAVFVSKAAQFGEDPAVGHCIRVAKGFAHICLVNTVLVLLPMCRNLVTGLRVLPVVTSYLPIDQHIEFHKICGVVLLLAALGHTAAWIAIIIYAREAPKPVYERSACHHLTFIREESLLTLASRVPIWTGITMVLCAAIAAAMCISKIRQGNFNLFWLSHMLFIPFVVLMAFHGFASWVAIPQAQYWGLPPLVIYLLEKRYRMGYVFGGKTTITEVQLFQQTVAIYMRKPRSFYQRQHFLPGIQDESSGLEGLKYGSLISYPTIYVDGPFGSPAQDYARYREVVLIAGGIGVTPFASILKNILYQWESYRCGYCRNIRFPPNFHLQKIYFYWVTRNQRSLTWFANTMNQLSEMDTDNRLEIHTFYTAKSLDDVIGPLEALQTFIHATEGQDIVSGLQTKQKTHFGRPDWNAELSRIARNHIQLEPLDEISEEIGVFFCGPKKMGRDIHDHCALLNQAKERQMSDAHFDFHSEKF